MANISRRKFLIGGSAVAATAAIAASTSLLGEADSKPTATTSGTVPPPRFDPAINPASWFDSPTEIAVLGGAVLGATILGACEGPATNGISTFEQYTQVVASEEQCGTLQQLGNWYLTPTEVAVAQRIHKDSTPQ